MVEAKIKSPSKDIGGIFRLFREKSRRKLEDVAKNAGISISMLSQIERGVVSPSLDTLSLVSRALSLDMAELFRRLSPARPVRIHRGGERLSMERDGVVYEQLMTSTAAQFPSELFRIEIRPGCATSMSGGGHEGTEIGYVLQGSAQLIVGTESYRIGADDSVYFNARLPHRLTNTGKKIFRAVWSISPPHVDYLKTGNERIKNEK